MLELNFQRNKVVRDSSSTPCSICLFIAPTLVFK